MPNYHIHISGQVQGVGFRPFIYKLAMKNGLKGWVNNSANGVHIELNCSLKERDEFCELIIKNKPKLAIISNLTFLKAKNTSFIDFRIIHSDNQETPNLLLTPDYGICEDCRRDILEKDNNRSDYAFTTCTNCGPRYSIIKKLPYDRENTTMHNFEMCNSCKEEYYNPLNRRYYSQTNSCSDCAVEMTIAGDEDKYSQREIIEKIVESLKSGKILAVKGIGGFLLLADATNLATILKLRHQKKRPYKPFALMYPNDKLLLGDIEASEKEWQAYKSIEAPIVLFRLKKQFKSSLKAEQIAPYMNRIGVMKPYTPLFVLIMEAISFPIIATSANISQSPIIYQNKKAEIELNNIVDLLVTNNRDIVVPQDDSVIQFSEIFNQKIILRRSRSFSPSFIDINNSIKGDKTLLAVGAGLKSSFCLFHQKNTYISQYLGNLLSFDTQEAYECTLMHLLKLFKALPITILSDYHPQYFSTQYAQELVVKFKTNYTQIQHHKAHFAAVLAENNLLETTEPVLGIIWDGVGLGDDQQIWGGEFFTFSGAKMKRIVHFDYFKHLAFDKFAIYPKLPALSLCSELGECETMLKTKFSSTEWLIYKHLSQKKNGLLTDSVGRIFDAVACLLGFKNENSYEGEAAVFLEVLAQKSPKNSNLDEAYIHKLDGNKVPIKELFIEISKDLDKGLENTVLAYKFHLSLVKIIQLVALENGIKKLAFSGGVFQNAFLVDLIIAHLQEEFTLYFHQQLSPNDENISFGQMVFYSNGLK